MQHEDKNSRQLNVVKLETKFIKHNSKIMKFE